MDVGAGDGGADFAFRALIASDLLLVEARVVTLRGILCEDVRAVGIVREKLVHHEWRLHHALIDVCPLMRHCWWMLLTRGEKEGILVGSGLSTGDCIWNY